MARVVLVEGMHSVLFEMKQAHLSAMRFGRRETEPVGLTPARLDMLRVVLERSGRMLQRHLRRLLCVSNSVISIMVRALERIGFVTRTRCREDRRTFVVKLTRAARLALRKVFYTSVTMGFLELALTSAFVEEHFIRRGWQIRVERLRQRLRMFRAAFGIGDTSYDPWEPNDDDGPFYYAAFHDNPNRIDLVPDDGDEVDEHGNAVETDDDEDERFPWCDYA